MWAVTSQVWTRQWITTSQVWTRLVKGGTTVLEGGPWERQHSAQGIQHGIQYGDQEDSFCEQEESTSLESEMEGEGWQGPLTAWNLLLIPSLYWLLFKNWKCFPLNLYYNSFVLIGLGAASREPLCTYVTPLVFRLLGDVPFLLPPEYLLVLLTAQLCSTESRKPRDTSEFHSLCLPLK